MLNFGKKNKIKVSIIIPNYNYAKFLKQRINSILKQSYQNYEILILDDLSTDNSLEIIQSYENNYECVRYIPQIHKAQSLFSQWQLGIEHAKGEIIWICESDDFCEADFLENLLPSFNDPSVMIAFGRILTTDINGKVNYFLDYYRKELENINWDKKQTRFANEWFLNGFGIGNIIPNVGGCLIRKQPISKEIWQKAATFKVVGDWYLYLKFAQGGRIAYNPKAISYFRQHDNNTSSQSFSKDFYYKEHQWILEEICKEWPCKLSTILRASERVAMQCEKFYITDNFTKLFSVDQILKTNVERPHILICSLGFFLGGGEIVPISLANKLVENGWKVSFLALVSDNENQAIRRKLDLRIAVYYADDIKKLGINKFVALAGIQLINSHFIYLETLLINDLKIHDNIPYIVTLHGSYENIILEDRQLDSIIKRVNSWIYLTKKNIAHINADKRKHSNIVKIINGVEEPQFSNKVSRSVLNIPDDALVFSIASRCIPEKGWLEAIQAIKAAQLKTKKKLHLLLCGDGGFLSGDGSYITELKMAYGNDSIVSFLGYQENVYNIYKLSDCAMLPTRYRAESFPLTILQAMQIGLPVISTDIGEIRNIMTLEGQLAGIIIQPEQQNDKFIFNLEEAILEMADDDFRAKKAEYSRKAGELFTLDKMAKAYETLFSSYLKVPYPCK